MIAQVEFAGNHEIQYDFFTNIAGLMPGDIVVCDTVRGYSCGVFVGYIPESNKATRWLVCRVPVEEHRAWLRAMMELEDILL